MVIWLIGRVVVVTVVCGGGCGCSQDRDGGIVWWQLSSRWGNGVKWRWSLPVHWDCLATAVAVRVVSFNSGEWEW